MNDVENGAITRLPRAIFILHVPPPRKLLEGALLVEREGVGLRGLIGGRSGVPRSRVVEGRSGVLQLFGCDSQHFLFECPPIVLR